jgi:hypothetical protein
MRNVLTATLMLFGLLAPGASHAICKGLQCNDTVTHAFLDDPSNAVWIQTSTADETNLDCVVGSGPAPLERSLKLSRTSPIFAEAYQVLLLATASQLPVQINLDAGAPDCVVNGIILDPFGKLSP